MACYLLALSIDSLNDYSRLARELSRSEEGVSSSSTDTCKKKTGKRCVPFVPTGVSLSVCLSPEMSSTWSHLAASAMCNMH